MTSKALARLVVASALAWGASAVAASPGTVVVQVRGPDDTRALYESSLREVVGRVGLAVREAGGEGASDVLAIVAIDTSLPDEVRVSVTDAHSGKRIVERDLSSTQGANVAREDAVLVVRSALDALVEKERQAPPPAPEPPAPAPVATENPPPAPSRGPSFDLTPFARASSFASGQGALFGGGVAATVDLWQGAWHPSFSIAGAVHVPQNVTTDGVEARAAVVPLRALASLALVDVDGWGIDAGVGGGADVVALSVTRAAGPPVPAPGVAVDPVATAMLRGRAPLGRVVALEAAVGVDEDLETSRFVVERGPAHDALFAPLSTRAWVTLGVSFRVAGPGRTP